MREPRWLDRRILDAIHEEQLTEHGGQAGTRDENLVESALARPRHKLAYAPESDLALLAAAYGFGLATNHPYLDGNKRVAFVAMLVFLGLNGKRIECPESEVVEIMVGIADSRVDEPELATWLRERLVGG